MDVLFLKNPKTGEVLRFFARATTPHNVESFEGWVAVDGLAWADANADHELVNKLVAQYYAEKGIEPPASAQQAANAEGGA